MSDTIGECSCGCGCVVDCDKPIRAIRAYKERYGAPPPGQAEIIQVAGTAAADNLTNPNALNWPAVQWVGTTPCPVLNDMPWNANGSGAEALWCYRHYRDEYHWSSGGTSGVEVVDTTWDKYGNSTDNSSSSAYPDTWAYIQTYLIGQTPLPDRAETVTACSESAISIHWEHEYTMEGVTVTRTRTWDTPYTLAELAADAKAMLTGLGGDPISNVQDCKQLDLKYNSSGTLVQTVGDISADWKYQVLYAGYDGWWGDGELVASWEPGRIESTTMHLSWWGAVAQISEWVICQDYGVRKILRTVCGPYLPTCDGHVVVGSLRRVVFNLPKDFGTEVWKTGMVLPIDGRPADLPGVIIGATNTKPVTISLDPGAYLQIVHDLVHVQISGVMGNTAVNGERVLRRVDATHYTVWTKDYPYQPVTGNGAWTSGGDMWVMGTEPCVGGWQTDDYSVMTDDYSRMTDEYGI